MILFGNACMFVNIQMDLMKQLIGNEQSLMKVGKTSYFKKFESLIRKLGLFSRFCAPRVAMLQLCFRST